MGKIRFRTFCIFILFSVILSLLFSGCGRGPAEIYIVAGGFHYIVLERKSPNKIIVRQTNMSRFFDDWNVSLENDRLKITTLTRESGKTTDGLWIEGGEWMHYYESVPSKDRPADWDLVRYGYNTFLLKESLKIEDIPEFESPFPSYFHRVDDGNVLKYYNAGGDPEKAFKIASDLLAGHPDDPWIRFIYMDSLLGKGEIDVLGKKIEEWEPLFQSVSDPFLRRTFRFLKKTHHAHLLSSEGKNAFSFVMKTTSTEMGHPERLRMFPRILEFDEFDFPLEGILHPTDNPIYLPMQVSLKVFTVESVFRMIRGERKEALELLESSYHLGRLLRKNRIDVSFMIGTAFCHMALRPLEIFVLNCCETGDEINNAGEVIERIRDQDRSIDISRVEWDPMLSLELQPMPYFYQTDAIIRDLHSQARFELIRTALEVKRSLIMEGTFPEDIEAIKSRFQGDPPKDPFTGKPLHYRRETGSAVCYSLGPDKSDDRAALPYDPTNGISSRGDISLRIPREREYPFPRHGVRASSPDELKAIFPTGLPPDPFANTKGKPLGVTNTSPVKIYSYGPDTDEIEACEQGDSYVPEIHYDPTNGVISGGDLFMTLDQ